MTNVLAYLVVGWLFAVGIAWAYNSIFGTRPPTPEERGASEKRHPEWWYHR